MSLKHDFRYLIMRYAIREKGAWWATHGFQNKACRDLYHELIEKDLEELKEMRVFEEACARDWKFQKRGLIMFLTIMAWMSLLLLVGMTFGG